MTTATGRVYKRGKKIYMTINKGYINGERVRETKVTKATTLRDAKQLLDEELYKLNRAAKTGRATDNNYLISELHSDWIDYIKTVTPNPKTCNDYMNNAERAVKELEKLGIINVSELNLKVGTKLQKALQKTGVSHNTINKSVVKLKAILEYGLDNKLIAENPIAKITLLPTVRVKYRRAYTTEEVHMLLKLAPDNWRPFYHFAVSTGCRMAEIANIRWEDINIPGSTLRITPRLDWKPKTKSGERTIPMTEKLKATLSNLPHSSEYVFATRDGQPRLHNTLREFKKIVRSMLAELYPDWSKEKRAEEAKLLDFHALRYTFCTELIKNGVDIKTVQKIMGHADVKTTLGIYAQYVHGGMEDAIQNISW